MTETSLEGRMLLHLRQVASRRPMGEPLFSEQTMSALIELVRAEDGWRDISTALKDGTEVLVSQSEKAFLACYETYFSIALRGYITGWRRSGYPTGNELPLEPTHWKPLPKAPSHD